MGVATLRMGSGPHAAADLFKNKMAQVVFQVVSVYIVSALNRLVFSLSNHINATPARKRIVLAPIQHGELRSISFPFAAIDHEALAGAVLAPSLDYLELVEAAFHNLVRNSTHMHSLVNSE